MKYALLPLCVSLLCVAPAHAGLLSQLKSQVQQPTSQTSTATTATAAAATATQSSDLVQNVMSQLNLNQTQAEGGLGSLLTLAKSSLDTNQFTQIADSIPNVDSLLAAAPAVDSNAGVSGLLSKAGSLGTSLQGSAAVYDAFSKLGISKDLAAPMVEILQNYLQSNASAGTAGLLSQGLGSLF